MTRRILHNLVAALLVGAFALIVFIAARGVWLILH